MNIPDPLANTTSAASANGPGSAEIERAESAIAPQDATNGTEASNDSLIRSNDPLHPANHIATLCRQFYGHGWVTGTGGGVSIRQGSYVYIAPSGVQKELMQPQDMFVMDYEKREYLRRPKSLKPSACTPLFLAAFTKRNARCCIHTHSQWAVLVTLICEAGLQGPKDAFAIKEIEQIKGLSRGGTGSTEIVEGGRKAGNFGFYDTLRLPIIDNTAHEEDLSETLEAAIDAWPEACAVLVRRHGVYVWGKDVAQAKTQAESLDYLFQLAVEMHRLGLKWASRGSRNSNRISISSKRGLHVGKLVEGEALSNTLIPT